MEINKELISKENAADIIQQFYNKVEDVPSKFLLSEVRCALLSAPAIVPSCKFDTEYALACLKRAEQRVYDSFGVPAEYFIGLKQVFQDIEKEILDETSPTT